MLEVVLNQEDTNSESAVLVEWLAGDLEPVHKGQPVCVVETAKASIEIEAPGEGTICHLYRAGQEVAFVTTIALVAESAEELAAIRDGRARKQETERSGPANATRKAIELAEAHGIDLSAIESRGFITAGHVEALIARADGGASAPDADPRLAGVSTENVSLPATFGLGPDEGRLDEAFLASLRADPESVRALPPGERLAVYRRHGARIGEGVQLGERTLVVAPQVVIEDNVVIGDDGLVRCEEAFAVGPLTHFGTGLEVTCRRAYIGANGHVGRGVRIGGGGARDPWATFVAGDLLFVGDEAFVNPCRPVLIGREVFLTMRSIIVTHNVGHSVLEGFENRFAPVVLEDRAQVGLGAVLYAGCRIGREAIVASGSYVVADVPPGKLAAGVPARVTGSSFHPLSRDRQARLLHGMVDDLRELLELRGVELAPAGDGFVVRHDGRTSLVVAAERVDAGWRPPAEADETIVLTLEAAGIPEGSTVLDLLGRQVHGSGGGPVLDAVREFCRKRGIRLEPGPWRYSGGLL